MLLNVEMLILLFGIFARHFILPNILYALIVFSNFVAKIPFIKFLYISYCSVVLYDFFLLLELMRLD